MNTDQHRWVVGMFFSMAILLGLANPTNAIESFTIYQYDSINISSRLRIENTEVGTSLAIPWHFELTKKFMKWGSFEGMRMRDIFNYHLAGDTPMPQDKIYNFDGPRFLR